MALELLTLHTLASVGNRDGSKDALWEGQYCLF